MKQIIAEKKFESFINEGIEKGEKALEEKNLQKSYYYYNLLKKYYKDYKDKLTKKERKQVYGKIIGFYSRLNRRQ